MRLMCWDVDIVHQPDTELVDADYWSRLGVDLDFDSLLHRYLAYALERCSQTPSHRAPHAPQKYALLPPTKITGSVGIGRIS